MGWHWDFPFSLASAIGLGQGILGSPAAEGRNPVPRTCGGLLSRTSPLFTGLRLTWPSDSSSISLISAELAFTRPAQSAPGPKPVIGLGWVGQGLGSRAKGAGLGCPLCWEQAPHRHEPVGRPHCLLDSRLWEGLGSRAAPPASVPTLHPFLPPLTPIPSLGPGARPGVAGAAAAIQCFSQWAVEPNIGMGEGSGGWL